MIAYMKIAVPLAFFLLFQGCDTSTDQTKKSGPGQPRVVSAPRPGLHRFVLTRAGVDVAFDTQTGQICRTWEWTPTSAPSKPNPTTGMAPQRAVGEFAPTCLLLYQTYPSGVGSASEPTEQSATDGQ